MSSQTRLNELVGSKLAGRKLDVVGFVDGLLEMARVEGEIQGSLASESVLRFKFGRLTPCDVELDAAKGKLRMLCARLAELCANASGPAVSPYGGEGIIHANSANGKPSDWKVEFVNTASQHEFTIASTSPPRQ